MDKVSQKNKGVADLISKQLHDEQIYMGKGGDSHQVADKKNAELTTWNGTPIADDQNSLKFGARGPTLLEDFILREKIFHFDHERIPERVVHARGFGAHGYFETFESLKDITSANIFQKKGEKTPAFVRFSTVAGNKVGAVKDDGIFYLDDKNVPVLFIKACRSVH